MKLFLLAILIGALPLSLGSEAVAQGNNINPQCAKMKMARQCTCAVETGGFVTPDGHWRYKNSPAYANCMRQRGWM